MTRWAAWFGAVVAVLSFAAAYYVATSMVLFESGCHMGNEQACWDLAAAGRIAVAGFALGTCGVMLVIVSWVTWARRSD